MFYRGAQGDVLWAYTALGTNPEDWSQYIEFTQDCIDRVKRGRRTAAITIAWRSSGPNRSQRALVNQIMAAAREECERLAVHAFVSDNALHCISLKAFRIVTRIRGMPEKAFFRPRPAIRWILARGFELSVSGLANNLRREVPADLLWPSLAELDAMPFKS